MKCTQYCHSGHLNCCNLPSTVVEQTEVSLVSQDNFTRPKQKRGELMPAKSTKKSLISQDEPPPCIRGLRLTIKVSFPTRAQTAKTLAQYSNTAGIAAKLSFICLRTSNKEGKMSEKNPQAFSQQIQEGESQNKGNSHDGNKGTKENFNKEDNDKEEEEENSEERNGLENSNEGTAGGTVDDGSK